MLLLLFLLLQLTYATQLPVSEVESNFDIIGQDLASVKSSIDLCFHHCLNTKRCTAWSWNKYNDGTCWLKSGADMIISKNETSIGRLMVSLNGKKLLDGVDFIGNDISNKKAPDANTCIQLCKDTFGCRSFTWSSYESGTCWLKSKRDVASFKNGAISADIYSYTFPHSNPINLYKSVGKTELKGVRVSIDNYITNCQDACYALGPNICAGYTRIDMHHTMCMMYATVDSIDASANPYGTSYVRVDM